MNTKPRRRAKLTTPDVFRPNNGLNIRNAGESIDRQIERLINAGFDDETIARKTFPGDATRPSSFLTNYLVKIARIRKDIESA